MKKADFPYTGFWTSWFFEDPNAIEYEQYLIDRIASPQICEDIKQVLLILKKYELLIPTYVQNHPKGKFEIKVFGPISILRFLFLSISIDPFRNRSTSVSFCLSNTQ